MKIKKLNKIALLFVIITMFVLFWFWAVDFAFAQQRFEVKVDQVGLSVIVFGNDGELVTLKKENFRVFEKVDGNLTEQDLINFSTFSEQPISLAVLIDSSESMGFEFYLIGSQLVEKKDIKLERAKNGAKDLVEAVFREGTDRAMIAELYLGLRVIKDDKTQKESLAYKYFNVNTNGWVRTKSEIFKAILDANDPRGATPFVPALFYLSDYFLSQEISGTMRVLVTVSDGENTEKIETISGIKKDETIEKLQNNQVLVFSIGLYDKPIQGFMGFDVLNRKEPKFIEVVAEATGGQAFFVPDLKKLPEIFQSISKMLRNVNFLSYVPKSERPGHREIIIEVGELENGKWKKWKHKMFHRKGYNYFTK